MALLNFLKFRSEGFDFNLSCNDSSFIKFRDSIYGSIKQNLKNKKLDIKKDFLTVLLLNLRRNMQYDIASNPHYIGILVNKNYYSDIVSRYRLPIESYEAVKQIIRELQNLKLIEFHKGYKGKKYAVGLSSKFRATNTLKNDLNQLNLNSIAVQRPKEFIILRDINKNEIPYPDNQFTIDARNDLLAYTSLRENTQVTLKDIPVSLIKSSSEIFNYVQSFSPDDLKQLPTSGNAPIIKINPEYLVRIFNENTNFKLGGRFYRGVESGLRSGIREYFHFNGNKTKELDYSGSHLRLLYHLNGMNIYKDPYTILSYPANIYRKFFKSASLTMINASSEDSALRSIMRKAGNDLVQNGILQKKGLKKSIKKLCDNFIKTHKRIEKSFYSGAGLTLMNIDSEIANEIMMHFTNKEIFVMCIHDSFIIDEQYEQELKRKMKQFYKAKVNKNPIIK